MAELQRRYGQHPVLIETEADYTTDPIEHDALYVQATQLAIQHHLPTYTIRLSHAEVLLHRLHSPDKAWQELQQCRAEVASLGDAHDQPNWQALVAQCEALQRQS